jgi:hypothetical protein
MTEAVDRGRAFRLFEQALGFEGAARAPSYRRAHDAYRTLHDLYHPRFAVVPNVFVIF